MIISEVSPFILYFATSYESLAWPPVNYLCKGERLQGIEKNKGSRRYD